MSASQPLNILVVDDEPAHLMLSVRALRKLPFPVAVLQAADRAHAEDLLRQEHQIALFVIDLNLAGESGILVIQALKAMREYASTPVIIISTSKLEQDLQQSQAAGADLFLNKSSDPSRFQDELREAAISLLSRYASHSS